MQQDDSPTLEDLARWHEVTSAEWQRDAAPLYLDSENVMGPQCALQRASSRYYEKARWHRDYAALVRRTMRETAELEEELERLGSVIDDMYGMSGGFW